MLGRDSELLTVGIDAEEAEPLEPELWRFVLTEDERAALEREPAENRGLLAKVVFSAKECFYKAQYPLTRQFLGFKQVRITLNPGLGTVRGPTCGRNRRNVPVPWPLQHGRRSGADRHRRFPGGPPMLGFGGNSRVHTALEGDLAQGSGDRENGKAARGREGEHHV